MNFAGAIVNKDDESEWQIVNNRLSDRSSDRDELAFSVFAHVAGFDRKRLHFWTTAMRFDCGHIYEHEQSGQDCISELPCHANLLPEPKAKVVRSADVDSTRAILNRKALIESARAECTRRNRNRTINGDNGSQRQTACLGDGDCFRILW